MNNAKFPAMTYQSSHSQAHWQNVYRTRSAESVSWFRPHLEISLEFLTQGGAGGHVAHN